MKLAFYHYLTLFNFHHKRALNGIAISPNRALSTVGH